MKFNEGLRRGEVIKVIVCGAAGRMGREVCKAVLKDPETNLVAACDLKNQGQDVGELIGAGKIGVVIEENLKKAIEQFGPDVMVDFTHPASVMNNIRTALKSQVHVVVGTTGLTTENLDEVKMLCSQSKVNAVVSPNFSLGAVLMMKMAELAAPFFENVEIIELHHPAKADAPSGTALKTAENIVQKRKKEPKLAASQESLNGVRGGDLKGIKIHSVRLPGLVAHQKVIFGGPGQTLTIAHDSIDRTSFIPGVLKAVKEVSNRPGLTYGLESLLGL
jgi:4-hydroxy-tetrahydrodipicolinate reductase